MKLRTITLVVVMLSASTGLWGQQDPFVGTWKLNLAKSKFDPGPAPKSRTLTMEPFGKGGVKFTLETIGAQGNKSTTSWSANPDGKQYSYVQTPPPQTGSGQMMTLKRVDSHTMERTTYLNGKKLTTVTFVVSKDGKTMTNKQVGTSASGQAINDLTVYDKQ